MNSEQLREAYKLANEREKASFFPTTGGVSEHKSVIPLDYQSKQRFAGTHFKDYCGANAGTVDEWMGMFSNCNGPLLPPRSTMASFIDSSALSL